jgi:hypothetical protein
MRFGDKATVGLAALGVVVVVVVVVASGEFDCALELVGLTPPPQADNPAANANATSKR